MPPPELAADAPVFDVCHPVVIHLRPALRVEAHFSGDHARLGRIRGRLAFDIIARGTIRSQVAFGEGADGSARGGGAPPLPTRPRPLATWVSLVTPLALAGV